MNNLFFLAAEAAANTPEDGNGSWWKGGALVLLGMMLMKLASFVADWVNGKGREWFNERFLALQEKVNSVELLGQIQADDALLKIVAESIPEVLLETADTAKKDLADGKFDGGEWNEFGKRLWDRVKPHVEGGKNDYLKHSSFSDGEAAVRYIAQKWFSKKKAEKEEKADDK